MDWTQFAIFFLGNTGFTFTLWLWARAESRSDMRHFESSVNAQLTGIRDEMKDFHGRLISLEERSRK